MNAPQHYVGQGPGAVVPLSNGDLVLFADVEEALRDRKRLAWIMPLIDGSLTPWDDQRRTNLNELRSRGLRGVELVDGAMAMTVRQDWLRPVLTGVGGPEIDKRRKAIAEAAAKGLDGTEMTDEAMRLCAE